MEIYDLQSFGDFIYQLRKKGNLTQNDIRNINGIHPKTIKRIEYGQAMPTLDTLDKLSAVYHVNLVEVLESFRHDKNEYFDEILEKLDYISLSDDVDNVDEQITKIKAMLNSNTLDNNVFVKNKLKQLYCFSELIKLKNNTSEAALNMTESYCYKAIRIMHPKFSVENVKDYYLNLFELRILISLSFNYLRKKDNDRAEKLIADVIALIIPHTRHNERAYHLLIHTYYMQTYILFLASKHTEVIQISKLAIGISKRKFINKFLPMLYLRKGISEFRLGDEEHLTSLRTSLDLLKIMGMIELRDKYSDVISNMYGIDLSVNK